MRSKRSGQYQSHPQMTTCPKCKLPVFKASGCNNITCANCGTRFLYDTGEEGGSGSSNRKLIINVQERKKLSCVYGKSLSSKVLSVLLDIEAREPKRVNKDILLLPIKQYLQNKNKTAAAESLGKRLEQYYLNRLALRDYYALLADLEHLMIATPIDEIILIDRMKRLPKSLV